MKVKDLDIELESAKDSMPIRNFVNFLQYFLLEHVAIFSELKYNILKKVFTHITGGEKDGTKKRHP